MLRAMPYLNLREAQRVDLGTTSTSRTMNRIIDENLGKGIRLVNTRLSNVALADSNEKHSSCHTHARFRAKVRNPC